MNQKRIKEKVFEKYIKPIQNNKDQFIGIEIEMPIVNLNNKPTDQNISREVFNQFIKYFNFSPDKCDDEGNCFSATLRKNGDNISFDCSYNNLELSLGKETDLNILNERFTEYVTFLNALLRKHNHLLTGLGINPRYSINDKNYIPSKRYRMLERFLSKAKEWSYPMYFHPYYGYGTYSSASQVQLDFSEMEVIDAIKAFSLVEPIKAILFSNSIMREEPDYKCVRDLLWENSTHGINKHNIGVYEQLPETIDELIDYIASTSIFNVERDGIQIHFEPIVILDYLNKDTITGEFYDSESEDYKEVTFIPKLSDIDYLRSYKFEDLTFRGTIEFRSCCNQPFSEAMTVSAFHLGLKSKIPELLELLENDQVIYHKGYTIGELRNIFNKRELPQFVDKDSLRELIFKVLNLAKEGLEERNLHEEVFLEPLFKRTEFLISPADFAYQKFKEDNIEKLVENYSDFNNKDPLELN